MNHQSFMAAALAFCVVLFGICSSVRGQDEATKLGDTWAVPDAQILQLRNELHGEITDLESRLAQLQSRLDDSVVGVGPSSGFSNGSDNDSATGNVAMPCDQSQDDPVGMEHVWEGSFPGSIRFPGSSVSAKLGGFIKADFIHDFDAIESKDNFDTATIFTDGRPGENTSLSARPSRLNLDVRWPVHNETIRTFVEGDFFSDNNAFRLRFAYGELGPWLVGQTWTAFTDIEALPQTLDFESPAAFILARRPTIRWTRQLNQRWSFAVAAEDPRVIFPAEDELPQVNNFAGERTPWPDVVARMKYAGPNAEHQFAGIVHMLGYQFDLGSIQTETGWGLAWSGFWQFNQRHRASYEIAFGDGIGNLRGLPEAVPNNVGGLDLLELFAATAGYKFRWNQRLASNFSYSYGQLSNSPLQEGDAPRNTNYVAANLIWTPAERVEVGVEYLFGRLETFDGSSGDANRIQMSFRFLLP